MARVAAVLAVLGLTLTTASVAAAADVVLKLCTARTGGRIRSDV